MAEKKAANKADKTANPAAKSASASGKADGEAAVLAKIAAMPAPFNEIGKGLHEIVMRSAPVLTPRVRYGFPWYMKDEKSWCFFRAAEKFGFITFGFDDPAILAGEVGAPHRLVASAYRIAALDDATEARLAAIVRKAAEGENR